MKTLKKLTAIILCAVLMLTAIPLTVFAAEERTVADSGFCGAEGENLRWTLYDDGELVISGEGEMAWYCVNLKGEENFLEILPPWYGYYNQIKVITLEEGVTSIGNHAFAGENLGYHRVNIPLSLKTYDGYPLDCSGDSCDLGKVCNVYYPGDKFDWGNSISRLTPEFILNDDKTGYTRELHGMYRSYDISTETEKIRKVEMCYENKTPEYSCVLVNPTGGILIKDKGDERDMKVFYNANGREDVNLVWKTKGDSLELECFEDAGGTGLLTNAVVTAVGYGEYYVWVELVDSDGKVLASSEKVMFYTEIYEDMNFFETIEYYINEAITFVFGISVWCSIYLGLIFISVPTKILTFFAGIFG